MASLKDLLNHPLPRGNSTHATLLAVVGSYLIYMAYSMVKNTLTGASTMSMTATVILAAVMGLIGLAVIGYAGWMWWAGYKASKEKKGETEEEA